MNDTTMAPLPSMNRTDSTHHLRLALTITHLSLVCIGTVNLLVIFLILIRPRYMRSITNVYMIGLCLADFIYLANLTLVAATQLKDRSWPFGSAVCTIYHGTETTGKYASVLFVVLLAADRYCAMCRASWCARYRNYRTAIIASILAWIIAFIFALPLYINADLVYARFRSNGDPTILCILNWPNPTQARLYISISSICIFAAPLILIVFCYYHILNKLREAVNGSKRLRRAASTRAPYHRVTRLVLWVVIFHVICWSPFWLFNLFTAIFHIRITTQFERILVNIVHLFPYVNCALNPLLYAVHAENFRQACRSIFGCASNQIPVTSKKNKSAVFRNSNYVTAAILPVNGNDSSYTIIKDKSLLDQPMDCQGRSLSDSHALLNQEARLDALGVIHNRSISRASCNGRLGKPIPDPTSWRKYSDNDRGSLIAIPQREEEHSVFIDSSPVSPVLKHMPETIDTFISVPDLPLGNDSDTNL